MDVSGQVGRSRLKGEPATDNTATGGRLTAGYRWDLNPQTQFGVKVDYAHLGTFNDRHPGISGNAKLDGILGGADVKFHFDRNWYALAEGGLFQARQHVHVHGTGLSASVDETKSSWFAGMGFGHDFTSNVSLGLSYDYYGDKGSDADLSSDMFALQMEVRF